MNASQPVLDVTRKYVRFLEQRPNGLVEFEFAIGDPELCVEMLLPEAAYREFCHTHQVTFLDPAAPGDPAQADWDWDLRAATQQRFR